MRACSGERYTSNSNLMSASPRPMIASPWSSPNTLEGVPCSSSTAMLGPLARRLTASASCDVVLIDTRSPTRVPQPAQKKSCPFEYARPHLRHFGPVAGLPGTMLAGDVLLPTTVIGPDGE